MEVTSGRSELDLDPFDVPISARIYIDYKNNSDRPVTAVKFRIRFTDHTGKDRGTFHAPDMSPAPLGAGQVISAKWKHEKVHPATMSMKIRVLQAKYQDGGSWQSARMAELANPPAGAQAGGGLIPAGQGQAIPPDSQGQLVPDQGGAGGGLSGN
ncbi:MAG TPA: hypothetical protein V6D17_07695 [Candidatus Obscuribacterales bacterium]